jgi:integrase
MRRGGCPECSGVSHDALSAWSSRAEESGARPSTIASVIATVTLLASIGGTTVAQRVRRTVRPVEIRHTPTLSDVDAVIAAAADPWWRDSLSLAVVTGMRLSDLEQVANMTGDSVTIVARKTGKRQTIPLPGRLAESLRGWKWGRCRKVVYRDLRGLCDAAGVARFTPQGLRRLSANLWERAHAGAGAVILGHAVPGWTGATAAYIDRSELLRIGLPRLRLPAWLSSGDDSGDRLNLAMQRLTPEQRENLVAVAVAMAR